MAGLWTETERRVFDSRKRSALEKMDRAVQQRNAVARYVQEFVCLWLRCPGSLCHRKGWRDVLRIFRSRRRFQEKRASELVRRSGTTRYGAGEISRGGLCEQ